MFKKLVLVAAALAVISCAVQAAPNVQLKYSGPSGQGDLIWWAPSTGTTNLVMTTNGVSVFTVPTGSGVVYTNASLTITRQAALSVTNIVVTTGSFSNVYAGVTSSVTYVTGVTIQSAAVAAVTNVVLSNP